jgi:hypothetical protein
LPKPSIIPNHAYCLNLRLHKHLMPFNPKIIPVKKRSHCSRAINH